MNKQIEDFLKKIGVAADTITAIKEEDAEKPANVEELADSFKTNMKNVFQNESDFIQPIKDDIRGTELSKIEHKIKKAFSLSADDVRDKKFEEILDTAINKIKHEGASTNEDLQNELINLRKEVKRFEDEVIPAKEQESRQKIDSYKINSKIRQHLGSKSMIVAPEVIFPSVNSFLTDNYSISYENNEVAIKTKDGLNPLNTDGTKVLTMNELIDGHLNKLNLIKQSNGSPANTTPANGTSATSMKKNVEDDKKFNLPGMKRAEKTAEQLTEMKTFGKD